MNPPDINGDCLRLNSETGAWEWWYHNRPYDTKRTNQATALLRVGSYLKWTKNELG